MWGSNYTEKKKKGKKKEASWFHLLLEKFNVPNSNIAATLKENLDLLPLMFSNLKQSASEKDKKGRQFMIRQHRQFQYDQRLASGNN